MYLQQQSLGDNEGGWGLSVGDQIPQWALTRPLQQHLHFCGSKPHPRAEPEHDPGALLLQNLSVHIPGSCLSPGLTRDFHSTGTATFPKLPCLTLQGQ